MKITNLRQMEENQFIDMTSGEMYNKSELIKLLQEGQKNKFKDTNEILIALGELPSNLVINSREYEVVSIKKSYQFNKIFRVEVREIMLRKENKLSLYARATVATLECFISFPSNCVTINGAIPSRETLCELVGVGKSKMYEILNELEHNEIIKRQKENGGTVIYFNPFLYCSGKVVSKTTYDMFKDSMYKPSHIIYE